MREYEKFIKAVETSGEVIFLTDTNGLITYVNPEFTRLYGYTAEEVVGRTTPRILKSGVMGREDYVAFWKALLKHRVVSGEFVNRCKDGTLVTIEGSANPILDEHGNLSGFLAIQRDISRRKQVQQDLIEAHDFLQSVIDGVADPLMVIGGDYRIRLVNQAASRFFNLQAETYASLFCYQVSHHREMPCNGSSHPCPLEQVRINGRPVTVQHEHYHKDGTARYLEIAAAPYLQSDGCFQGIIESWRDVTERKLADEELRRYTGRLRALAAQFSEVEEAERQRLAGELHDQVGQNLTAIGINLNIIRVRLPEEVELGVRYNLNDAQSLVEQTAERIRHVMADLRPPVLDDYGLGAALSWYCDRLAKRAAIQVTVICDETVPRMEKRVENALFRIAQEALTNVVKHAQATHVTVALGMEGDHLLLRLEDNGIGFDIDRMDVPEIDQGWGLLSMRERAEAVGASCSIESSQAHGTSIIVQVPL